MRHLCIVGLAACLSLAGCPNPSATTAAGSAAPPVSQRADGATVLARSGVVFPAAVGDFRRVGVRQYTAAGDDVSVGYDLTSAARGGITATVYVYPAPAVVSVGSPPAVVEDAHAHLARDEFDRRKAEVFQAHAEAALVDEADATLPQDGRTLAGRRATFTFGTDAGGVTVPTRSELYVFANADGRHRWSVEYRFSYAAAFPKEADVARFMADLPLRFRDDR